MSDAISTEQRQADLRAAFCKHPYTEECVIDAARRLSCPQDHDVTAVRILAALREGRSVELNSATWTAGGVEGGFVITINPMSPTTPSAEPEPEVAAS